ncbi:hypothetical protein BDV96DRAFT_561984 [Lophiotrema nucula]|uniref:Uncharacterized protein n=1 Tax=Lophiotrema nucula TaxID=690887 RepID=A0A6A5ZVX0_9PLEO|nr:hypothetical protein BDV96DRAFT_561984 [Lophiotrema nucula]
MTTPPSSPSPLPTLLLTEALLKLLGGTLFLLSPATILKNLMQPPYPDPSLSLIRSLGTQTLAFSVPLFLASTRRFRGPGVRRVVYWTLLAREGILAAGLLGQIVYLRYQEWCATREPESGVGKDVDVKALEEGRAGETAREARDRREERKILKRGLWLWVAELVPFVVGRIWILEMKPGWFD